MKSFWTSVHQRGDQAYVRGYADGRFFSEIQEIQPYLFVEDAGGEYRTVLDNKPAKRMDFSSVKEAREFAESMRGVSNRRVHGLQNYLYTHINDEFPGTVEFDSDLIARCSIDIETDSSGGFPDVETADKEINAITLTHRRLGKRKIAMFGLKPYKPKNPEVAYQLCKNEIELLEKFLEVWNDPEWTPDIITGWYIDGFDIPYIIRRVARVLGDGMVKMLSPWRIIKEREISRGKTVAGNQDRQTVYEIFGVSVLDYMELYKKFSFKNHESFKLDHIAMVELGEKKTDYSEYGSLDGLYRLNPELYYDYNLQDTLLVDKLDEKLGLIDLVLTFAYDAKIAFNDTMTTTRPWDVIIHNYLIEQGYVVPENLGSEESAYSIVGGYVKDVVLGLYDGMVNYDFDSLYPHLIMGWNISPETCVGKVDFDAIASMKRGTFDRDVAALRPILIEKDAILAGNGYLFSRKKRGFLPALMDRMYKDRVQYKEEMKKAKRAYEETKDKKYLPIIARYQNLQQARKIALNSAFGALANQYYRWFANYLAEAITTSGQMSSMFVERKLNVLMNRILRTTDVDYVVAVDTDSAYLHIGPILDKYEIWGKPMTEVIEFMSKSSVGMIEPTIHSACEELTKSVNCLECKLHMKRENLADKGVWTAKKRYIMNVWDSEGIRYSKPEVKVVGIESVRSSTPMICRDSIKRALWIMMNEGEAKLQEFIAEFKRNFMMAGFEDVASPRSASGLAKYSDRAKIYGKGTPIQVRGALLYNHYLREMKLQDKYSLITEGSKVKYCYLRVPNPIRENVIAVPVSEGLPPEFELESYIDRATQYEKAYVEPLRKITTVMGWETQKTSSLMDFL